MNCGVRITICLPTLKTEILNVNLCHTSVSLILHLDNTSVLKIFGLWFRDDLNWSHHVTFIVEKLFQRPYVLRILKSLFSRNELILVFNSIIQSVSDYGTLFFMNYKNQLNEKLVKICERAFRIIHGYDVRHCEDRKILDPVKRRNNLVLKLFKTALFSRGHILPSFFRQSDCLVLLLMHVQRMFVTHKYIIVIFCIYSCEPHRFSFGGSIFLFFFSTRLLLLLL